MTHEGHSSGTRPVILVDDDAVLREALRQALVHALDCPVVAFGDGPTALEYVRHTPPGLALLDVDMEPWGGLEVAKRLRDTLPEVPVVFVTGSNHLDLAEEFASVGAVANLRKPVRTADLVHTINRYRLRE